MTNEKNRVLPDASRRERLILAVLAVVILWMGIGSPLFTRRTEASTANLPNQMSRPHSYVSAAKKQPEKSTGVPRYARAAATSAPAQAGATETK